MALDRDRYRNQSYDIWQRMAAGWERQRSWVWDASHATGEWMVAKLDPRPGQTILELACGTGETGFAAAAQLGDEGRLISTDFSPQMVEAARRRAGELGLTNCEFRTMDAERMDLGDDSVDGVLCRWGYMLMSDPAAALAETRRVLRDGGRLALSVWAAPRDNPWASIGSDVLVEQGHMTAPAPGTPGIFAMGRPERVRELVMGAGFAEPEIQPVPSEWRFESLDDHWAFLEQLAGAIAVLIDGLDEGERAAVRAAIGERAEPFRVADGGYVMPGLALNAVTS
jgi:ubiquinone/menaquinone biosynthesis C-methylase UbiE